MSNRYFLHEHNLSFEDFGFAVYCNGVVYSWIHRPLSVRSGPLSWGHTIELSGGCYVRTNYFRSSDPGYHAEPFEFVIDDVDDIVEIIEVDEDYPGGMRFIRYTGVDVAEDIQYTDHPLLNDRLCYRREDDGIVIDDWSGDDETILIPAYIDGSPVIRVDFDDTFLPQGCETFIVSEGVRQVDVCFDDNIFLARLEIPNSVELLAPPDQVNFNFWFFNQPKDQPVYLCGYYCGTPNEGRGQSSELIIRDGTIGIAGCADFRNYWHSVYVPDSVTYVGRSAFALSHRLEHLRLPDTIKTMGESAFMTCEQTTEEAK